MIINRKVLPWLVAGIALAAILLIVLVMVTQAAPHQSPMYTTNLLVNPGFEYGLSGWSGVRVTSTQNQARIHCGNSAVHAIPTYYADAYIVQLFQWDGGDLYASAWMMNEGLNSPKGFIILDGPNAEHVTSGMIDLTMTEWRRVSISETAAASGTWTVTAGIENRVFEIDGWIDDVWVGNIDNTDLCVQLQAIPGFVSYQGQVNIGGVPFSGTGYFRFAIVNTSGIFYWSNDGTDAITPTEAVTLTVVNGLFNALLGETNPITYGMFSDSDRWLRIWFDDGTHGVQLLEPDTQFTTAPFAFQADHSTTADTATSATYALTAGSATMALTSTWATTATYATTAGDATTALTATNALTATFATTATTALTATNALTATFATTATTALTATNALTATFATTATTALTATNALTATFATTATTALTATNATTATYATTALTATNAMTATYATTALTATNATTATNLVASPSARVYNNSAITIANATWITLTFNNERWDTNNLHSTSLNTSRLVAPSAGVYLIECSSRFAITTTGQRQGYLIMNANGVPSDGTPLAIVGTLALATGRTPIIVSTIYQLNAGDYVECFVYQTSGANLTVDVINDDSPAFMMIRMP